MQYNDVTAHFVGGTFWLGRSKLSNVRKGEKHGISPLLKSFFSLFEYCFILEGRNNNELARRHFAVGM